MKKMIQEIHRRSPWQVLGACLAGSWVALRVDEQLAEAASLPEWVRPPGKKIAEREGIASSPARRPGP